MERLNKTLVEVMQGLEAKKHLAGPDDLQQGLKKTLTKKEMQHIKVKYFHKGILGLDVDSSAWLYILSLKKAELLEALKLFYPELKNITLRIGEF